MLNGSVCVIDENDYLKDRFTDAKELLFFNLRNPEQLAKDVGWLLEHVEASARIAEAGYQATIKQDTWERRFEKLLRLFQE